MFDTTAMLTETGTEARTARAAFRLTEEELETIKRAAIIERRSFSDWLRLVAVDASAAVLARQPASAAPTKKSRSRKA